MRIAETIGALLCYRTEPALKLMRRDAVISGIGNARLSSFEPMLCRTALGKLPLVLTSLANRAIDENLEARAKVMLTSPQKLSPTHYVSSPGPAVIRRKVFHFRFMSPYPELAQIYRIYPGIRMSIVTGTAALKRSAATESRSYQRWATTMIRPSPWQTSAVDVRTCSALLAPFDGYAVNCPLQFFPADPYDVVAASLRRPASALIKFDPVTRQTTASKRGYPNPMAPFLHGCRCP